MAAPEGPFGGVIGGRRLHEHAMTWSFEARYRTCRIAYIRHANMYS